MRQSTFTARQRADFHERGYLIARRLLGGAEVERLRAQALAALAADPAPLELEREVGYPGSPASATAPGADTPRRLLQAYTRGGALAAWARDPRLISHVQALLGSHDVLLCQAHHNCVMTKHPRHSSDTGWHQDLRYWSFSGRELINSWLALGPEFPANGGLRLIAGSHRWRVAAERLDPARFLRPEHPLNSAAIAAAEAVELAPGDVLFFDAGVFHGASRNHDRELKLSVVYTFYPPRVAPLPGTKSAAWPAVPMAGAEAETRGPAGAAGE